MTPPHDRERRDQAIAGARRFAQGSAVVPVADRLRALADAAESPLPDLYGEGGDITALEREVAHLLGKPAAVVHAERHDGAAVRPARLGRPDVTRRRRGARPLAPGGARGGRARGAAPDPAGAHRPRAPSAHRRGPRHGARPYAALCVELPLRDAGYLLPPWEDLVDLCSAARDQGIPVHLDGARLWESQPFYDRSHAEIADLADTVYVSFYKGLGGIAGAALAGPEDVVDAARHWQHRHGGTLFGQYPYVVAARQGLARLDDFQAYAVRARELAVALGAVPGLRVHPQPPHTNAFVLYAEAPADALTEAALDPRRAHAATG